MLSSQNQPLAGLDIIRFSGLQAFGRHGIYDSERENGQEFIVDVDLFTDVRRAAVSGELSDTFDYSEIAPRVKAIIEGRIHNLIEEVAEAIAQDMLSYDNIKAVRVCLHKPHAPVDAKFDDASVTIWRGKILEDVGERIVTQDECEQALAGTDSGIYERPEVPHQVILALGANLGDPVQTMQLAITQIGALNGIELEAVGSLVQSRAVLAEGQEPQPDYFNTVIAVSSALAPYALLEELQGLEQAFGRVREEHWGPRTLDIDIVDIDGIVSEDKELTIPHPLAHQRAFVLAPWAEFAPQAVLGSYGNIVELAEQAPDADGVIDGWVDWYEPVDTPEEDMTLIVPSQSISEAVSEAAEYAPEEAPEPVEEPQLSDGLGAGELGIAQEEMPRKFASRRERRKLMTDDAEPFGDDVDADGDDLEATVAEAPNFSDDLEEYSAEQDALADDVTEAANKPDALGIAPAPAPELFDQVSSAPAPSQSHVGQVQGEAAAKPKGGFWHKLSAWLTSSPEEYNQNYPVPGASPAVNPQEGHVDNAAAGYEENEGDQAPGGKLWHPVSVEHARFEPGFSDESELADGLINVPHKSDSVSSDSASKAKASSAHIENNQEQHDVVQRKTIMQHRGTDEVDQAVEPDGSMRTEDAPTSSNPEIARAQKIAQGAGDIKSQIVRPTTTGSIPIVKKKTD